MESMKDSASTSNSPASAHKSSCSPTSRLKSPYGSLSSFGSLSLESVSQELLDNHRPTFYFYNNRAGSAYFDSAPQKEIIHELSRLKSAFLSYKMVPTLIKTQLKEMYKKHSAGDMNELLKSPACLPAMPIPHHSYPPPLPGLFEKSAHSKPMFLPQTQSAETIESFGNSALIGQCSREERSKKVARYLEKRKRWKAEHNLNRKFLGRSKIAENKPRVKGRFVKMSTMKPSEEAGNANIAGN